MFQFNFRYFLAFILLFSSEVCIIIFSKNHFIRYFFGDVLVVALLYCFIRSFIKNSIYKTVIAVLAFSFLIETLQYFNFIHLLGLQKSTLAKLILGTTFSWSDIFAYILGALLIVVFEKLFVDSRFCFSAKASAVRGCGKDN